MKLPFKYLDRTFWVMYIFLLIIAILALFSASSADIFKYNSIFGPLGKQAGYLALGFVGIFVSQFMPSKFLRYTGYAMLIGSLICLYIIFLFPNSSFVVEHNGAKRWFKLGHEFQPSEIAKGAMILAVAQIQASVQVVMHGHIATFLISSKTKRNIAIKLN